MAKIIEDTGPKKRKISANIIPNALGAEKVGIKIDTRQGPISLFSLRQLHMKHSYITGGRNTSKRNKIELKKKLIKSRRNIRTHIRHLKNVGIDPENHEKVSKNNKKNELVTV